MGHELAVKKEIYAKYPHKKDIMKSFLFQKQKPVPAHFKKLMKIVKVFETKGEFSGPAHCLTLPLFSYSVSKLWALHHLYIP